MRIGAFDATAAARCSRRAVWTTVAMATEMSRTMAIIRITMPPARR